MFPFSLNFLMKKKKNQPQHRKVVLVLRSLLYENFCLIEFFCDLAKCKCDILIDFFLGVYCFYL